MPGPLQGLKVLDFSGLLPGPFASLILADLGADVLRVEAPSRPDMVRLMPPYATDGTSAAHGYLNRSKRSIAIDLKKPEGLDIVKQLIAEYDIVIEQFRPGVMDRLGAGYEALKAINPKVIYCSITGYGQTGPAEGLAFYPGTNSVILVSLDDEHQARVTKAVTAWCDESAKHPGWQKPSIRVFAWPCTQTV